LKGTLANAFQASGSGFGFTYNGRIPFLRIDHQFYSEELKSINCKVIDTLPLTDHFPLISTYMFLNK
ncbi:MAG: endonuclease/exonuclease/phosphatase, partial [Cytophagaceae bacterium]